jgi:dihydrofolate reductase
MAIIGIVGIGKNNAIGKNGKLPWHYSEDLKFFKRTTTDNAIVMGFDTWKSIGKALPRRLNIVLSGSSQIENKPNVLLMRSSEEVQALSKYLACDIFIIGGAKTYESFADLIEKWIVTEIPETVENADAFMPETFLDGFELSNAEEISENLKVKTFLRSN